MKYDEYLKLTKHPKIQILLELEEVTPNSLIGLVSERLSSKICASNLIDDYKKRLIHAALIIEQIGIDPDLIARVVNPYLFIDSDSITSLSIYCRGDESVRAKVVNLLTKYDFSYGEYTGDMFTLIMTMAKDDVPDEILSDIINFARDDKINFVNKLFAYETIWKEYIRLSNIPREEMHARVQQIMAKDMTTKAIDFYHLISKYCTSGTMDKIQNILQH